jgi:hypothetical protein
MFTSLDELEEDITASQKQFLFEVVYDARSNDGELPDPPSGCLWTRTILPARD